jgi:EAL domain-containing protein (putative c-di-GMP-specific phosphodiesterase class I)/GGDEF domain-containing protein/predicted transcriptional regulator
MKTDIDILNKILEDGCIMPVYQPIVSLTDGQIFGYEALSRISEKELEMDIGQMFKAADKTNRAWELEALCRTKALKNSVHIGSGKKLFLNVNPNIIHDEKFMEGFTGTDKAGFTKTCLDEYGLDFHNIIFEITERIAIIDSDAFMGSIKHYRDQKYGIAIDDVGAGYSGLNTIANVRPNIMKLDMGLIRNIDKDETKQFLCKAMVDFGKSAGILLIAEGIETEEELKTLIKLNVDLGQGFFLDIPRQALVNIEPEKIEKIKNTHTKKYTEKIKSSIYPIIGHLSKQGHCFSPKEKIEDIYEILKLNHTITDFIIIEDEKVAGFMSRTAFIELVGGRYGFSLFSEKSIRELAGIDFLRVNYNMPIDQVSRLAMQRPFEHLYSPIVVEKEGKYAGIVTIKDLLDSSTKLEIDIAMHSNPLTRLPGNLLIEKEILNRIFGILPYCILYYDLDNFKAYNDAYGFKNGDKMLALVADSLKSCAVKNEFLGHIGGDDFIVICDYHEGENYCKAVLEQFSMKVTALYRDEDVKNGFIISKNRHGVMENFPLASLSIAGISNKVKTYRNIDDFSNDIALLKKKCKRQPGNYFEII